jgi:hypothetical protein
MPRSFDWSEYVFWEIRGTGLTGYVRTCQGHLTDQNMSSEKSEALDSHAMLEHAKVIWLIRIVFWEIRGTGLTRYIRICQGHLTDQNMSSEKLEALDSHTMWEHAKIIWLIRTCLLRNQRHWTHKLYENMPRSFDWSEYVLWEIRGTRLTYYVRTCQGHLTDQNMSSKKLEALDLQPMLEYAKVIWLIRTCLLRN